MTALPDAPGPAPSFGEPPSANPTPRPPRTPVWLWLVLIGLFAAVVVLQRPEAPDPAAAREAHVGLKVEPPGVSEFVLFAKLGLAMRQFGGPAQGAMIMQLVDQQVGNPSPQASLFAPDEAALERLRAQTPAADRIRAAILAGELEGPSGLRSRLELLEPSLDEGSELKSDVALLRALADEGADVGAVVAAADPAAVEGLKRRHALFAELALTRGDAKTPARVDAAAGGMLLLALFGLVFLGLGLALVAGLVLLVIGIVTASNPRFRWAFAKPDPAAEYRTPSAERRGAWSSVWLETVAVFVAGFLALKLVSAAVAAGAGPDSKLPLWFALIGQWVLVLTIFWPIVRGMSFARWKDEIGWRAPRGVAREVGFGVLAYVAALPVYFAMAAVVVVLMLVAQRLFGGGPPPQGNRVLDVVSGGSLATLVFIFLLATVWAPIVEESIFRGALYRHLRRRWFGVGAAIVSAFAFAVMHGYVVYGLVMVGTLGVAFAVMREWRGSLISCVTAHFIHNFAVLSIISTVVMLARS